MAECHLTLFSIYIKNGECLGKYDYRILQHECGASERLWLATAMRKCKHYSSRESIFLRQINQLISIVSAGPLVQPKIPYVQHYVFRMRNALPLRGSKAEPVNLFLSLGAG
jgi:hypothetical protein